MPRTAGKAVQGYSPGRLRPRLGWWRPGSYGVISGRASPHLPPDWSTGIGFLEVVEGSRPENAAELVSRQLVREGPVEGGLFGGGRKHKEDVGIVGFAPVLEVADVVRRLSAKALDGLRSPVPLQEERDLPAKDQVAAPAVRGRGMPATGVVSEYSPATVFAHPVVQPLAGNKGGCGRQRDEERVGPEVVPDVEAVIPTVLAQADQRSGVLAQAGGKHTRPPWRQQQKRVESGPARGFDHWPPVDEAVILEPLDPTLGNAPTGEKEVFDLITIEVPVVGESHKDCDVSRGESPNEFSGFLLGEAPAGVAGLFTNKEWTTE